MPTLPLTNSPALLLNNLSLFMEKTLSFAPQYDLLENVQYVHLDKDGNIKPIWQENWLHTWLMKHGFYNPLWVKIPFLLGYWKTAKVVKNLITSAGKAAMASRCNGAGGEAAFTSIGLGTGTTAANVADTALEAGKLGDGTVDGGVHILATASVTASRVTTTVTNDTAQLVGTAAFTATVAVTESGVFNANTAGVLLCRQVFSAINVVNGDSIQVTWKVKAA